MGATRSRSLLVTMVVGVVCAAGLALATPASAAGNASFVGHWTDGRGGPGWVITSQDSSGACVGTSDYGSPYTLTNCQVTGNGYVFDIDYPPSYVSHNSGTINGNTVTGSYHDSNGHGTSYTAYRQGATVDVADATVAEPRTGTVTAQVPVALDRAADAAVSVHYATSDGTATTAHGDYVATSGTVTIPAGSTSASFPVTVKASGLTQDATVGLTISDPSGPTGTLIGTGSATLTISDKCAVRGSIETRAGRPVGDAPVTVSPTGTTTGAPVTVTTDSGGNFSTPVDGGTYLVVPQPGDGRWVPTNGGDCTATTTGCAVTVSAGHDAAVDFVAALAVDSVSLKQPTITSSGEAGDLAAVPDSGTYDGNTLSVSVVLSNTGTQPVTTGLALGRPALASDTDAPALAGVSGLPAQTTVPAHGSVTVTGTWDTDGTAWTSSGQPDPTHLVRATPTATPAAYGQTTVTVRPRPVILVHGLASDASTWAAYQDLSGFLHQANPLWQGFAVGDGAYPGTMNTDPFDPNANSVAGNATEEARYVRGVRSALSAAHVDIVAHSMGGLISRQYIATLMPAPPGDGRPVATHLVMLGTPNLGSPCAYPGSAALYYGGVKLVGGGLPVAQLQPDFAAAFNRTVTDRKGVAFSILAGHSVPTSCGYPEYSDQVVPMSSALWNLTDRTVVPGLLHTSMTSSQSAFDSWVLPHLRQPAAAVSSGARRATPVPARTAASVAAQNATLKQQTSTCTTASGGLSGVVGGDTVVLHRGHDSVRRLTVSRGSSLSLVLLHQPGLSATLTGPRGIHRSSRPGSPSDAGLFSTLSVRRPPAGRWTVRLSTDRPSLPVAWSLSERSPATSLRARAVSAHGEVRRIVATLRGSHRTAHVSAVFTVGTGRVRRTLHAVPGHRGRYLITLPTRLRGSTVQVLLTATGRGLRTTTLLSTSGGCR